MSKKVLIIGTGLGALATALRLSSRGYEVEMLEKYHRAGGRLNQLEKEGFTFDMGPSFFSMSYEFEELFRSCGIPNPLLLEALDPVYSVRFANREKPFYIHKDLKKLAAEFNGLEIDFEQKMRSYLDSAKRIFHDTEDIVIRNNFNSRLDYLLQLTRVPLRHSPKMFRSMWTELSNTFQSEEARVIFSLVAFFLGSTPFQTPAVYSLLSYTELEHDGYWNVKGGMYRIVTEMLRLLGERRVKIHYNTEIIGIKTSNGEISGFTDVSGKEWKADIYISNSDAASFRGKILNREKFSDKKLDAMEWTLAPFTIYLGVKGEINNLIHHNYFLGSNFKAYADTIFKTSVTPEKPYYYVNVSSKSNPESAPPGCENIFILCPVPDLRHKKDWSDADQFASTILQDLSSRIGTDLEARTVTKTILSPVEWRDQFNLYQGSGLGLAHGLNQVGGWRPSNKDEKFSNLYYVGASTTPGTGLPMVIIGSKLVMERIEKEHGNL
ncbi:MAG TPA: phytoene desaturase family protein [Bacteroidia bacterium]|nr:phytoene desaturase family protein [Bacteroidia bacterium]